MIALLYSKLSDPQFMAMILVGIAAAATVFTVAMPLVEGDSLGRRMKAVALERDKIRARERERLSKTQQKVSLRQAPKAYMKQTVDRFKLNDWLGTQSARNQLVMAGYRGQHSEVAFLFFRLVMPIAMILIAWLLPVRAQDRRDAAAVQARRRPRRGLSWRQGARDLSLERDLEAPGGDAPLLARRPRPAPDLRRIGHVDRAGLPPRCRRGRLAVHPAGRGARAHDRRAVLPGRAAAGL